MVIENGYGFWSGQASYVRKEFPDYSAFANKVQEITSDRIKKCLASGQKVYGTAKNRDGIEQDELDLLMHCWELQLRQLSAPLIHKSFPWLISLWMQSTEYFDLSFDCIAEMKEYSSNFLIETLKAIHREQHAPLIRRALERLESNPSLLTIAIREMIYFNMKPEEKSSFLRVIVEIVQESSVLKKLTLECLSKLRLELSQEDLQLPFGADSLKEAIRKRTTLFESSSDPNLLRHEVLNALGIRPDTSMLVAEHELALAHGDSFIKDSGFEGYYFKNALKIFLCFKEILPPRLRTDLENLLAWEEKIGGGQFEKMAEELKKTGRLVVPAGWSNKSTDAGSHAMIAEAILHNEEGTATLRLYNQGAGVRYHQCHSQPFRDRRDTYYEKTNIPIHLVTDPAFWMILLGFRYSAGTSPLSYDSSDLYEWVIQVLPGVESRATTQKSPQSSGTCAFKTPLCFFKTHLGAEEYDRFILRFKFGILARYEEDLHFRRPEIDLPQKRFLREIREKLLSSVDVQEAAGAIDAPLADLLRRYCRIEPEFPAKKEENKESEQLVSVFTQRPPFIKERSSLYTYRYAIFSKGLASLIETAPSSTGKSLPTQLDQLREAIKAAGKNIGRFSQNEYKGEIERKGIVLLKLLRGLPSLDELFSSYQFSEEWFNAIVDDFFLILRTAKQLTAIPSLGGVPTQLVYAWFSELSSILSFQLFNKNGFNLFYSLEYLKHPLEQKENVLNQHSDPMSSIGESLLEDWLRWRYNSAKIVRSFTIGIENTDKGRGLSIASTSPMDQTYLDKLIAAFSLDPKKINDIGPLSRSVIPLAILFPDKFKVQIYLTSEEKKQMRRKKKKPEDIVAKSLYGAANLLRQKIEGDFDIGNLTFLMNHSCHSENGIKIPLGKQNQLSVPSPLQQPRMRKKTLPFVGIEREVSEIEQYPAKIAFFAPEINWFSLSLVPVENGFVRGVQLLQSAGLGYNPFRILLHSDSAYAIIQRLQNISDKICSGWKERDEVYSSLFRLAGKINLRHRSEKGGIQTLKQPIILKPCQELQNIIENSQEVLESFSLYLLSLPEGIYDTKSRLEAYYFLLISESLKQDYTSFALKMEFLLNFDPLKWERELGGEVSKQCWSETLKKGVLKIDPNVEIYRTGAPYLNDVFQASCDDWFKSPTGAMLNRLLNGVKFGPWESINNPQVPENKFIVRRSIINEKNYFVEEHLECNTTLCTGAVLDLRLKELGFDLPVGMIAMEGAYSICPSDTIYGLPPAMQGEHFEYWRPHGELWISEEKTNRSGILIDPIEHQCYEVKLYNKGKKETYNIIDLKRGAKLVAGKVRGNGQVFFNWNGNRIRIPHFGQASMDVSIWTTGSQKQTKFWINCMNGKLRFKIEPLKSGGYEYISEDYEGFKWDPAATVAELGLLHGVFLKKEREEILILSLQSVDSEHPKTYRPLWENRAGDAIGVLSRTLHPELDESDPAQTLFTCDDPIFRILILQELLYQRHWERAYAYLNLIPPLKKATAYYHQLIKLFEAPLLDNPKARVIRLRLLVRCAGIQRIEELSEIGYPKSRLLNDYETYINNYHLLEHGFVLNAHEERTIASWVDPKENLYVIKTHLCRVFQEEIKQLPQQGDSRVSLPVNVEAFPEKAEQSSAMNDFSLNWIYRPRKKKIVFGGLMKRLLEPASLPVRLIQAGLLWFCLKGCPNLRKKCTPILKRLLSKDLSCDSSVEIRGNAPIEILRREFGELIRLNIHPPFKSEWNLIEELEKQLGLKQIQGSMQARGEAIAVDKNDTRSIRQKVRQKFLTRNLLTPDQQLQWVRKAISQFYPDRESLMEIDQERPASRECEKDEIIFEEVPSSSRKRKLSQPSILHSPAAPAEKISRRSQIEPLSVTRKGFIPEQSLRELLELPRLKLKKKLEDEVKGLQWSQQCRLQKLQPLFRKSDKEFGKIGLRELFFWLDGLDGNPQSSAEKEVAELLIDFAECSVQLKSLMHVLELLNSKDPIEHADLRRTLQSATIRDFDIEQKKRERLAVFMWRYQIAFRSYQLAIIEKIEKKSAGVLAQLDCGDGKSFVISPAICNLSEHLVFNIVPPGISEEHARRLSKYSSSWKGALTQSLITSRATIWEALSEITAAIDDARRHRVPIVTTVSDIASLFLCYDEALLNLLWHNVEVPYFDKLEKMLQNFKRTDILLLDEIDTAAKEQIHWTIGNRTPISKTRIAEVETLYDAMLEIENEHGEGFFCLSGKQRFSSEMYRREGMPLLIERLLDTPLLQEISDWMGRDFVKEYLLMERGAHGWETWRDKLESYQLESVESHNLQGDSRDTGVLLLTLKWLRAQLHVYLPHTLKMRYKVHYGFSGETQNGAAVPYKSAHYPDPKSQYTYVDIHTDLTIQGRLQEPPTDETVKIFVRRILKNESTENSEKFARRWLGKDASIVDLVAIADEKEGYEEILKAVKNSLFARLDIATRFCLPKIEMTTNVLRFTMASLTASMAKAIGLTATPNNRHGMNARLAENFIESDAYQTSRKIIEESAICPLPQDLKSFIEKMSEDEKVHALIDPNALLIDYTNEEIAQILINKVRPSISYIVFWEIGKDRWAVLSRSKCVEMYNESRHKSGECFFFYDQTRSRGMDLPLPKNCTVEVLVGEDCTFTTLKQATERARRIKEGLQQARFWMENEQSPSSDKLLKRLDENEIELLKEELPLMARREMTEVCNQRLTEAIWNYPASKAFLINKYSSLRLHTINHNIFEEHADLAPHKTIDAELLAYQEELIGLYHDLLTVEDCAAISDYRRRVSAAISGSTISKTVVDLREEVIGESASHISRHKEFELRGETHHQQQTRVQTQAMLEKRRQKYQQALWDPKEVLPALLAGQLVGLSSARLPASNENWGEFIAARINKIFPRLMLAENIWISKKVAVMDSEGILDEEGIRKNPLANHIWATMPKADYILSVDEGWATAQHIALASDEGDQICHFIRGKGFSSSGGSGLTLRKPDGKLVIASDKGRENSVADLSLLASIALFNGTLGSLSGEAMNKLSSNGRESRSRLAFLKDRLRHYRRNEEEHFERNPLVQAIKSGKEEISETSNLINEERDMNREDLSWLDDDFLSWLDVLN